MVYIADGGVVARINVEGTLTTGTHEGPCSAVDNELGAEQGGYLVASVIGRRDEKILKASVNSGDVEFNANAQRRFGAHRTVRRRGDGERHSRLKDSPARRVAQRRNRQLDGGRRRSETDQRERLMRIHSSRVRDADGHGALSKAVKPVVAPRLLGRVKLSATARV